ncbi:hypothetical protein KCU65_g5236, partial [Aureobasidium melanogenum]
MEPSKDSQAHVLQAMEPGSVPATNLVTNANMHTSAELSMNQSNHADDEENENDEDDSDLDDQGDTDSTNANHLEAMELDPRFAPTFDPQESMADQDVDTVDSIELDGDLVSHGTDFSQQLSQDPVHKRILDLVEQYADGPQVATYAKVHFVKLFAINKVKAANLEDIELASIMASMSLSHEDNKEGHSIDNKYQKTVHDCVDQVKCLAKKDNPIRKVAGTLKAITESTGYRIPDGIDKTLLDDLACILIATTSDAYYKTAPRELPAPNPIHQPTPASTTTSLPCKIKKPRHLPQPVKRCSINVITHLSLVGGKPSNVETFTTHGKTTLANIMDKVSKALRRSRAYYPHRLGFLTDRQSKDGVWLYQAATDMETLDLDRDSWRIMDESSAKTLSIIEGKQVFLIHEYHQAMPQRIQAKLRGRPRHWNTWALLDYLTSNGTPAPEFLPCSKSTVVAPGSNVMTVVSSARRKPRKEGRKAKVEGLKLTLQQRQK